MDEEKFSNVFFEDQNTMKHGKLPAGLDWDSDFLTPVYKAFIDLVIIILYYFISYYKTNSNFNILLFLLGWLCHNRTI